LPSEADEVNWPHVVISERVPEGAEAQTLTIVHGRFSRVVEQDASYQNIFLVFGEPPLLWSKLSLEELVGLSACLSG